MDPRCAIAESTICPAERAGAPVVFALSRLFSRQPQTTALTRKFRRGEGRSMQIWRHSARWRSGGIIGVVEALQGRVDLTSLDGRPGLSLGSQLG
eukprot:6195272-Pleurochrysis_carterae.AAC.2